MTAAREIEAPIEPPMQIDGDIVVLPREISEDGRGLYDDSVITIVKEFRALGVEARYQHSADERTWIGEQAAAKLIVDLIVGIASNAGWTALWALLRGGNRKDHVRVRVARCQQKDGETSWQWYEAEGSGHAVAQALAQIEPPSDGAQAKQKANET